MDRLHESGALPEMRRELPQDSALSLRLPQWREGRLLPLSVLQKSGDLPGCLLTQAPAFFGACIRTQISVF